MFVMDESQTPSYSIAFVGAGRMASAIVHSLLNSGAYQPNQIACCSAPDGTAKKLSDETGIEVVDTSGSSFSADVLVIACKPQQLQQLDESIVHSSSNSLVISILAGTKIAALSEKFHAARNVVRVMPNTPGSIGEGVSGFAPSSELSAEDRKTVTTLLDTLGKTLEVSENQIDAVTAISGSGPAYFFLFVEGLIQAAKNLGFDQDTAMMIAQQTAVGSAKLLDQSELTPEELRIQVTSPGGTTQAAIESFKSNGFVQTIHKAARAAYDRSIELGEM